MRHILTSTVLALALATSTTHAGPFNTTSQHDQVMAALGTTPKTAIAIWRETGVSPKRVGQIITAAKLTGEPINVKLGITGLKYSR